MYDAGFCAAAACYRPSEETHRCAGRLIGDRGSETAIFGIDSSVLLPTFPKQAKLLVSVCGKLTQKGLKIAPCILPALGKGIDWLRAHICPYRTLDKAIGVIMGSDCKATAEAAEAGLRSYIAELRSMSGTLLRATVPFSPE